MLKPNCMKPVRLALLPPLTVFLLIVLFSYTASAKLLDQAVFASVLSQSPYLRPYADLLSWMVPLVEIFIIALLILPRFRWAGLVSSFILLAAFTVYIALMLLFSPHLPCMCGGIISAMSWELHLITNLVLAALSFWSAKKEVGTDTIKRNTLLT